MKQLVNAERDLLVSEWLFYLFAVTILFIAIVVVVVVVAVVVVVSVDCFYLLTSKLRDSLSESLGR